MVTIRKKTGLKENFKEICKEAGGDVSREHDMISCSIGDATLELQEDQHFAKLSTPGGRAEIKRPTALYTNEERTELTLHDEQFADIIKIPQKYIEKI